VKGIIIYQASLTSPIRPSRNICRASVLRIRKLVLNVIVILIVVKVRRIRGFNSY